MSSVYLTLLHYPVYNKNSQLITTSITNFDIHDLCRTARTYECSRVYFVHPIPSQAELVQKIVDHWETGYGATYNPDRREALALLQVIPSLQDVIADIAAREGKPPVVVTTSARIFPNTVSYRQLKSQLSLDDRPYLLVFGTGWGLADSVMEQCDQILEPIQAVGDYNHLPVRSAVAIILDRLLGKW